MQAKTVTCEFKTSTNDKARGGGDDKALSTALIYHVNCVGSMFALTVLHVACARLAAAHATR